MLSYHGDNSVIEENSCDEIWNVMCEEKKNEQDAFIKCRFQLSVNILFIWLSG